MKPSDKLMQPMSEFGQPVEHKSVDEAQMKKVTSYLNVTRHPSLVTRHSFI
jgi:hypothetical protein